MPGEVYYPSVVVNLRLRFDESLQVVEVPDPLLQGGQAQPPSVGAGSAPVLRPLITERGAQNLTQVMNRVPKSASIELPSYRQAGTFSLEFDWRELPIDPRLMRSIGVEIHVGAVSASDFSTGMVFVSQDGSRRSILNTQLKGGDPNEDTMALAGIVDDWSVTHDEKGSTLRLDGRDLRGIFLDSPVNPAVAAAIDLRQPIYKVVGDLLATHPAGQLMRIYYTRQDWPGGVVPQPADRDGLTRVRRGASGNGAQGGQGGGEEPNYWDLITAWCFLVGAIPYFRGRSLVIRAATSAFDQTKLQLDPAVTAFRPTPRVDDDGQPFTVRRVVYGRGIRELTFERKYAGVKVPVIEVVSLDTSGTQRGPGKLLTVQWPPKDEKLARVSGVYPSGDVAQTDVLKIPVHGVRSVEQLTRIAQALYEEIGRGELGGSVRTKSLASYQGDNGDPDLLRVRPGDAVEILVDARALSSRAPLVSELNADKRRPFDEQVKLVQQTLAGKAGGGDVNLARVLVATARNAVADLLRYFRVANVRFSWSAGSGMEVAFDFQNYFVARSQVTEQLGPNTLPLQSQDTGRQPRGGTVSTAEANPRTGGARR